MSIGSEIYNFFFKKERKIDVTIVDSFCEKIEKILIQADLNEHCINEMMYHFKKKAKEVVYDKKADVNQVLFNYLHAIIRVILKSGLSTKFNIEIKNFKKICFFGLSGSGKTSTIPKVAKTLVGKKVCCIRFSFKEETFQDIQLRNLCKDNGINYVEMPISIEQKALKMKELENSFDIILIDTDPIHSEKDILFLKKNLNIVETDLNIFIVDSLNGASVFKVLESFIKILKINAFIVSKTDSNSRFGVIFYIVYLIKLPILFITDGERINNIERYNPDKISATLLGTDKNKQDGNLLQNSKKIEVSKNINFKQNNFDFNNLHKKIEDLSKNFGILKINNFFSIKKNSNIKVDSNFKKTLLSQLAIINSMTKEEKEKPDIINYSRIKRIAKGSGVLTKEVIHLINEFNRIKNEIS